MNELLMLLQECRSSVAYNRNRHEQMAITGSTEAAQDFAKREATRLNHLLGQIDHALEGAQ